MPDCPYCHKESDAQVTLRKPRGVTRFTSTFTDYLRGRKRDRYDHSVAQPWQGVREPQAPPRQLGAGETVYRPFSWHHDIGPQIAFACIYGGFALAAAAGIAQDWPIIWVVDGIVCGVFTVLEWDVWRDALKRDPEDQHTGARYITQERQGENVPPPAPEVSAVQREEIDVNVHDKSPDDRRLAQDVRCTLFSPAGKPGNLARYAAALMRDGDTRAAFSYAGGKTVNGAKFYGYTPTEFNEFKRIAERAGLVERERDNQPYTYTDRGTGVFGRVARRGQSETTLPPIPRA